MTRVLHVAAEVFPLIKTGGLADVVAALPVALAQGGADVALLLPGFPAVLNAVRQTRNVADLGSCFGAARVRVLKGRMPGSELSVYVIDAPLLFGRVGGPYQRADGSEWPDNLQRFGLLGWVAAQLALGGLDGAWQPEIVHAHDWHAAMACAYLQSHAPGAVRSVFTVHNLAYQGLFPLEDYGQLGLPSSLRSAQGLEYHGRLSFMKAGLQFANRITTVSPTYAREIATPEFGCGLEGVIQARGSHVSGILNGIDAQVWQPHTDALIAHRYSADHPDGKAVCKAALQAEFGLPIDREAPLLLALSRLSPQKGLDLILTALPQWLEQGCQFVLQGAGDAALESQFARLAAAHPNQVGVHLGYDEAKAHRLMAGADMILVPSRFEPCGLTQLYGLQYGTLPIVRHVGGLADTVVDADPASEAAGRATGFSFDRALPADLSAAVLRAMAAWRDRKRWQRLMQSAMAQDFAWTGPARQYLALYAQTLASD